MYNVTLINLAADARSAADSFGYIERTGLTDAELRTLLQSFSEIDAVENAVAAPEIRMKVRNESYLIRTGEKKLMFYDIIHRELAALVLTVDEVMAELDGSAPGARSASFTHFLAVPEVPYVPTPPVAVASKPRLLALGTATLVLVGAILWSRFGDRPAVPVSFHPVLSSEVTELLPSLTGVYLTGNLPGHHGIVFNSAGELKLFELSALTAPRIVYASGELGRSGPRLVWATDQPGGLIEVVDHDTLIYCGESYRRVP